MDRLPHALWSALATTYNTTPDFRQREEALDLLADYATSYEVDGETHRDRYDGNMPLRVAAVMVG